MSYLLCITRPQLCGAHSSVPTRLDSLPEYHIFGRSFQLCHCNLCGASFSASEQRETALCQPRPRGQLTSLCACVRLGHSEAKKKDILPGRNGEEGLPTCPFENYLVHSHFGKIFLTIVGNFKQYQAMGQPFPSYLPLQ